MRRIGRGLVALLFIVGVSFTSLNANAQRPAKTYQISILHPGPFGPSASLVEDFRRALRELGYTEGGNLNIQYRYAENDLNRLQKFAAELARSKPDVIVAVSSTAAVAINKATQTIPIVMINVGDPIGLGLVASLSRPGGNVTGIASYQPELQGKNLEILKELVPNMKHVAILFTPANPLHAGGLRDLEAPARALAVQVHPVKITSPDDFENGFRSAVTEHATAVWVFGDALFFSHRARLAALALNVRLPTMFVSRQYVDAGGLSSYGPVVTDLYLRGATYVDKIVKGAKPSDLPVEHPTKFELFINLSTAKSLGLTIPQTLLLRADQVIE